MGNKWVKFIKEFFFTLLIMSFSNNTTTHWCRLHLGVTLVFIRSIIKRE